LKEGGGKVPKEELFQQIFSLHMRIAAEKRGKGGDFMKKKGEDPGYI